MFWILILLGLGILSYWILIKPYKYWSDRGVPQGNPVPFLGHNWGPAFRIQTFADMVKYAYNMYPTRRYSGFYQFFTPALVVKDPNLIKQITVKHFDHFVDHRSLAPDNIDPLMARNLFSLKGERWREMRAILSPAFTSSKMKQMFILMSETAEQFAQHFLKKNEIVTTVEFKDIFTRYTNDIIANAVFGLKCDSLEEPDNEFYLMGKDTTDFNGWRALKFLGYLMFPGLFRFLKVPLFSERTSKFYRNLVKDNIEKREKLNISRPDIINILLEARQHGYKKDEANEEDTGFATVQESDLHKSAFGKKIEITDTDITAQALVFFFGGFDSVSTLMCFFAYELAVNFDVQKKLIQEIDEVADKCGDKLTYDALIRMKYMDMVISETLRKWPNGVATDRVVTKTFTVEPERDEESRLVLDKGSVVWIPIYALHHDPNYFPNPEKFDPERFNDENKHKITPYTYLPFGAGPRNCIGSRFALLETKVLFYHILSNFEIFPVKKSVVPVKLSKSHFTLYAEKGFWFGFKRRVK